MILVLLCGHPEGIISQFVVSIVVGVDGEGVGTGPLFPIDDGVQYPRGVGPVVNGQVSHLLTAHSGSEVKHLVTNEGKLIVKFNAVHPHNTRNLHFQF